MEQKLYSYKVEMTIRTTNSNWMKTKKHINMCMNCGIVNELTDIKEVRFIHPVPKKKGKRL